MNGVMGDIIQNFTATFIEQFDVIYNLLFAIMCGVGIFTIFYITHRKISVSRSFAFTLILLPPVAAMVSVIVTNDIVLAVGMLGALSIIRFRHSMKESKNLVFVFWAVTSGIACGLSFRKLTVIWCAMIAVILLAIHFFSGFKRIGTLSVKTSGSAEDIEGVFDELSLKYSLKYRNTNETSDLLYEFRHKKGIEKHICGKIIKLEGVSAVRFIEM